MSAIPLVLFAKAPIAGKVKTRLQSHCSATQAAQIAQILLEESIKQTTKYWPGKVVLSVYLDSEHPFLTAMQDKYSLALSIQSHGDLGDKMLHAFETHGYPMAVMGCDAPHITQQTLVDSYSLLEQGKSHIAPSDDGGYYLLGLHEPAPALFRNNDWGKETVYQTTLDVARENNIDLTVMSSLQDIDEWQDIQSQATKIPSLLAYCREQKLLN